MKNAMILGPAHLLFRLNNNTTTHNQSYVFELRLISSFENPPSLEIPLASNMCHFATLISAVAAAVVFTHGKADLEQAVRKAMFYAYLVECRPLCSQAR